MPLKFSHAQVQAHLKELGYPDISESQLREFVRDLKKLIRHEEKREVLRREAPVPSFDEPDVCIRIEEDSGIGEEEGKPQIHSSLPNQPTTSFIRPRLVEPQKKTDPIKLYNEYKAYWDSINFPGDDSSKSLRWVIRERMMGPN
ncbi:uncharacterized protein Hyls1 [Lepeophtheirus salmonis]|uniref:uncharacterized protein Hyls1 n=1 Tax=Lepeophtheirus salmonis TaxID=72036 RepID=UPI001AEA3958|nr:hydrolethalus syndrome protein 1 homolog [Lepeophtheirus salmonis]